MEKTNLQAADSFYKMGIAKPVLEVLEKLNYKVPTPIQHKAIPEAIAGKDLIGIAQTGTGKTLAYGLPLVQRLLEAKGKAVVLLPTRELALQVEESLRRFGAQLGLKSVTLIGGDSIGRQLRFLERRPRIIVATPGRLNDFINRKAVNLSDVKVFVLDEADMMFDMGFAPQVEEILSHVSTDRQTLLFSATMPEAIVKLTTRHMKLPISIEIAPPGTTAELVEQEIYVVEADDKLNQLEKILNKNDGSVLIFSRTKHGARKIAKAINAMNHKAAEIHSDLSLSKRRQSLDGFKQGKFRVLVATDIAARGLDVNGISLVVNYDLPDNLEDYVHRIGRTGRAGKTGRAISFAMPDQGFVIKEIEKIIKKEIKLNEITELRTPVRQTRRGRQRGRSRGKFSDEKENTMPKRGGSDFRDRKNSKPAGAFKFADRRKNVDEVESEGRSANRKTADRGRNSDRRGSDRKNIDRSYGDRKSDDRKFSSRGAGTDRKFSDRKSSDKKDFGRKKSDRKIFDKKIVTKKSTEKKKVNYDFFEDKFLLDALHVDKSSKKKPSGQKKHPAKDGRAAKRDVKIAASYGRDDRKNNNKSSKYNRDNSDGKRFKSNKYKGFSA